MSGGITLWGRVQLSDFKRKDEKRDKLIYLPPSKQRVLTGPRWNPEEWCKEAENDDICQACGMWSRKSLLTTYNCYEAIKSDLMKIALWTFMNVENLLDAPLCSSPLSKVDSIVVSLSLQMFHERTNLLTTMFQNPVFTSKNLLSSHSVSCDGISPKCNHLHRRRDGPFVLETRYVDRSKRPERCGRCFTHTLRCRTMLFLRPEFSFFVFLI